MGAMTEAEVRERLKTVIDPELGIDIVSLGLVYKIEINEQKTENNDSGIKIRIVMTLTTPGCPLAGVFEPMVKQSLVGLEDLDVEEDVEVRLTFDPPWTMEMMSEEAKEELGFG